VGGGGEEREGGNFVLKEIVYNNWANKVGTRCPLSLYWEKKSCYLALSLSKYWIYPIRLCYEGHGFSPSALPPLAQTSPSEMREEIISPIPSLEPPPSPPFPPTVLIYLKCDPALLLGPRLNSFTFNKDGCPRVTRLPESRLSCKILFHISWYENKVKSNNNNFIK
jgi:hypothetical protein